MPCQSEVDFLFATETRSAPETLKFASIRRLSLFLTTIAEDEPFCRPVDEALNRRACREERRHAGWGTVAPDIQM